LHGIFESLETKKREDKVGTKKPRNEAEVLAACARLSSHNNNELRLDHIFNVPFVRLMLRLLLLFLLGAGERFRVRLACLGAELTHQLDWGLVALATTI